MSRPRIIVVSAISADGKILLPSDAPSAQFLGMAQAVDAILIDGATAENHSASFLQNWARPGAPTWFCGMGKTPRMGRDLSAVSAVDSTHAKSANLQQMLLRISTQEQIRSWVCAGGSALIFALLDENLVDEFFIAIQPVISGGDKGANITGLGLGQTLPASRKFRLKTIFTEDNTCYTHYVRVAGRSV